MSTAVISQTVKRSVGRPISKVTLKRVVLSNGVPVGRGRPSIEGKSNRTVVFIPIGETYDASKHGTGVKFSAGLKQFANSIKRVDLKKFESLAKQSV
jgi:hypothetical protein